MFGYWIHSLHRQEIAGQLVSDQKKAAGHHDPVERKRMVEEGASGAPPRQGDQNCGQREALADLDAHVEADDVGDEAVLRQREVLQLGRQAEAVEQTEDEHRRLGIRLETEEAPEEVEEEPVVISPETQVTARFLGADAWYQENVGVYGFVLDEQGQGLPDVKIEISSGEATVAEFVSGEGGRFEYNASKLETSQSWQIRLPDYPQAQQVQLDVTNGLRYLLEFELQPEPEPAPVAEVN